MAGSPRLWGNCTACFRSVPLTSTTMVPGRGAASRNSASTPCRVGRATGVAHQGHRGGVTVTTPRWLSIHVAQAVERAAVRVEFGGEVVAGFEGNHEVHDGLLDQVERDVAPGHKFSVHQECMVVGHVNLSVVD